LLSPVGPGSRCEPQLGLVGVVAAEVDRLAHLADAVAERLVRLLHQQAAELGKSGLERVGGVAQHGGARGQRGVVPGGEGGVQAGHRGGGIGGRRLGRRGEDRRRHGLLQWRAFGEAREVDAARVAATVAVQVGRQRQGRRRGRHQRGGEQGVDVDRLVGQLVHEGGIGAVLQQPAHQVGQQVAVLAHRRVDAHRHGGVLHDFAVHALAHAVQALHLERRLGAPRHLQDGGDGAGVVGGELRVDDVGVR
jgi:hypothetical protein